MVDLILSSDEEVDSGHLPSLQKHEFEVAKTLQESFDQLSAPRAKSVRQCDSREQVAADAILAKRMQEDFDHERRQPREVGPAICDGLGLTGREFAGPMCAVAGQKKPRQARSMLNVKVYVTDAKSFLITIEREAFLISVFSHAAISTALRQVAGWKRASPAKLADLFELCRPAPDACVFDRPIAERLSVEDALGDCPGVLRVRANAACKKQLRQVRDQRVPKRMRAGAGGGDDAGGSPPGALLTPPRGLMAAAAAAGQHDGVEVLRLRTPDGVLGSPVALVKNYNRDRGVLLARETGLKEMVEMAPEARAHINDNVRNRIDSHAKTRRNFTTEVRRASDSVLDAAQAAVRSDVLAHAALTHRTEYASTAVLVYAKDTTLPRHVDGCGHWVVLFSFGVTVDFFASERSFKFESGDALVFNGSTPHAVMHGIDHVHLNSTFHGKKKKLPDELSYMNALRASFQSRQGDP